MFVIVNCVIVSTSSLAEIYRWVDEKGNVHFGDKPGSADHEVIIQDESDFSTIGLVPEPKKNEQPEQNDQNSGKTDPVSGVVPDKPETDKTGVTTDTEGQLTVKEKKRLRKIEQMEALAAELKAKRLEREAKREKERKELIALREGCANAQDRINALQSELDRYIAMQKMHDSKVKTEQDVVFDPARKLKAQELSKKKEFVAENCQNL